MFATFKILDRLGHLSNFLIFVLHFLGNQWLKVHPVPPLDEGLATSSDKRGQPSVEAAEFLLELPC